MSMATILAEPAGAKSAKAVYTDEHRPVSAALLQAAAQASAQESSEPFTGEKVNDHHDDHHDSDIDDDEEDGDGQQEALDQQQPEKRKKRARACQACRGMKIRCLPVEGQEACKACSKVNRACVMPGPARKRQKTVHKVAELEKKIDALTASLAAKQQQQQQELSTAEDQYGRSRDIHHNRGSIDTAFASSASLTASPRTISTPSTHQHLTQNKKRTEPFMDVMHTTAFPEITPESRLRAAARATYSSQEYLDVIERNIVNIDQATAIFERWKREMCPYAPFVAFPAHVTVDWLRRKKPMTLLAILGSACGTILPDLQADLMVELARQLADRVMFFCEKSLDLAQALLICPTWYGKHKAAKDLGYNQYIHSAVTMCLDLGLGKRSRESRQDNDELDLEKRRLWMGAYYSAGNVTTVLRLPSLVKFSPYLEECLEVMSRHPAALSTDRWLCAQVKLMHMVEDVGILFAMDDPGLTSVSLSDTRTQYNLKMFSRQLSDWRRDSQNLVPRDILEHYCCVTNLYIHEIALHNEHNVDDFRPMAAEKPETTFAATRDFLTNAHFEALTICVDSMENAMTSFNNLDFNTLRGLPCLFVVWIAYVSVAMIQLHGIFKASESNYADILLPRMNVERNLDLCIAQLQSLVLDTKASPAENFLFAFKKLRVWFVLRNASSETATAAINEATSDEARVSHDASYRNGTTLMTLPPRHTNESSVPSESQTRHTTNPQNNHSGTENTTTYFSAINSRLQPPPQQLHSPDHSHLSTLMPHQTLQNSVPVRPSNLPGPSNLLRDSSQAMRNGDSRHMADMGPSTLNSHDGGIDASTFDIPDWDILKTGMGDVGMNMTDLNNFDTYMNDVGWFGYLM